MKLFRLSIFIVIFSVTVFGQSIKTAKVNSDSFEDDKTGIKELIGVLAKLDIEFKPKADALNLLRDKINKFVKEFPQKYGGLYEPIRPLNPEEDIAMLEKMQTEFKVKQQNASCLYQNRKKEVTESINKRIGRKLAEFNKIKGFIFIYDSSNSNSFVIDEGSIDVTKEFIKFCNEEFEKEKLNK
jgi:Skp family chaperone for outer membrane proteins